MERIARIALHGIVAHGRHGVYEYELQQTQPFRIDFECMVDVAEASASDDLRDTIDYAAIHRIIVEIVSTHSYALLEKLAAVILETIASDRRITTAQITVAKPGLLDGATPSAMLTYVRGRPKNA
jgi:7,8-dihydroneopterin aldolase/epimerase/oxygenase